MQEEIWKDVPGYEGLYQVSNLGRVYSLPKKWIGGKGGMYSHNGKILKVGMDGWGYHSVSLVLNYKHKTTKIHKLVAMAFLGHKPDGRKIVIDHINDNKTDNRVDNLQIVTQRFNSHKTQGNYSSNYKGVSWHKQHNKWHTAIRINGNLKHLGYFENEQEAHLTYQKALKDYELL